MEYIKSITHTTNKRDQMTGSSTYLFHTLAEDPASARDPFKPFFLINPEPENQIIP